MLRRLEIRDLLLIDHLALDLAPGLNVLTGETGAGKSILLDSLGFVMGWRGRADLVRTGADQGEVCAEVVLPEGHTARAVLDEAGIPVEDGEVWLRRVNTASGRKTAWVNDRRVSGDTLRALSDTLVELHGQHDDRGLLNPRGHRALLDAYGRYAPLLTEVRAAWKARAAAEKALAQAEAERAALRSEEDFLRHAVDELDTLNPEPGEDAALDEKRRLMQAATRVAQDVAKAAQAISDQGAGMLVGDAQRWTGDAAEALEGRLDGALAALDRAAEALGEAEQEIRDALDALDTDPAALEATEERLFAIRALARKHGVPADDLGEFAAELRTRLAALDDSDGQLNTLTNDVKNAAQAYDLAAQDLSSARKESAEALDAAMAGELAPLKMERARFTTCVTPAEPGPEGADAVSFTVATNPGAPAGPLDKIASGGELSRFLLALKVCLTGENSGQTLIFDEIDRGVGGATADAVGRRLARLAEHSQVLVVTHSPQVAARTAHHWRVAKTAQDEMTTTRVTPLDAEARVDELARMLSGDQITEAARDAARALIDG